jgi:hypothetical protein
LCRIILRLQPSTQARLLPTVVGTFSSITVHEDIEITIIIYSVQEAIPTTTNTLRCVATLNCPRKSTLPPFLPISSSHNATKSCLLKPCVSSVTGPFLLHFDCSEFYHDVSVARYSNTSSAPFPIPRRPPPTVNVPLPRMGMSVVRNIVVPNECKRVCIAHRSFS